MQCHNADVSAKMEIRALQLATTEMQWTMNEALVKNVLLLMCNRVMYTPAIPESMSAEKELQEG